MTHIYKTSLLTCLLLCCYLVPLLAQQSATDRRCSSSSQAGSISSTSTSVCVGESNPTPQMTGNQSGLNQTEYLLTDPQNIIGTGVERGDAILAVNTNGVFNPTSFGFQPGSEFCVTAVHYNLADIQEIIEVTINDPDEDDCCEESTDILAYNFCGAVTSVGFTTGNQVKGLADFFSILEQLGFPITIENVTHIIDDDFNSIDVSRCVDGLPICYSATNTLCYTYETCVTCPPAGTACSDGNPNTNNDVEDGNCNCTGTVTPTCPPAGTACSDGNPNTNNDVEDGNCNCTGTVTPTCPPAGTACSDGNPNTNNDVEDGNCNCFGTVSTPIGPVPNCPPAGTACNDGNPNTNNDVADGFCNCSGTSIPTCPPAGTVCNDGNPNTKNDVADGFCNCFGTITSAPTPTCPSVGTPCNDGNPNTTNDVQDGTCNCFGTPLSPPGPSCPRAGTFCNDGDPNTINDVHDGNCNCAGTTRRTPRPGEGAPACNLDTQGGIITSAFSVVCLGDWNAPIQIDKNTSGLPNLEYILTNPQDVIGQGVDRGDRILAVNANGVFNPSQYGLQAGDRYCITAVSYDLENIQDIIKETHGGCCSRIDNAVGFDFCGGVKRAGFGKDGKPVQGLGDFFAIMREANQPSTLDNIIDQVNNNFNTNEPGGRCVNGIFICFAATNTLCLTVDECPTLPPNPNCPPPGTPCNDGSPLTINDTQDGNCICTGTVIISFGSINNCPPLGTACNDGNPNTYNDAENGNCNCIGTLISTPNPAPACPPVGSPCNDGNPNTINDAQDGNCICIGTFIPICPSAGTPCTDGNPNTINDVEDGNCNCIGTTCPSAGTPCNDGNPGTNNDVEDGNCNCTGTAIPICPPAGTPCNDGNPNTINDVQNGLCICLGTTIPACPPAGTPCNDGNSITINDVEDGFCNCFGTVTTNPGANCPPAGTVCNDGNVNTINDREDGNCNCFGTVSTPIGPVPNCPPAGTPCNDGISITINDVEDGNCNCFGTVATKPGITCPTAGTPCNDGNANTINDREDGNCNCFGTVATPIGPAPNCPPAGTPCNDDNSLTINDVENGLCNCFGTVATPIGPIPNCPPAGTPCNDGNALTINDVQNGFCNCFGTVATPIGPIPNCPPAGTPCNDGNLLTIGDVEDGNCNCVGRPIFNCIDANNNGICDSDETTATPVTTATPCLATPITMVNNNMIIDLNPTYVSAVIVFDVDWNTVYQCWNNSCQNRLTVPVQPGNYVVDIKYYTNSFSEVCRDQISIVAGNSIIGTSSNTSSSSRIASGVKGEVVNKQNYQVHSANKIEEAQDEFDIRLENRDLSTEQILVYPNPASQELNVVLSPYVGQHAQLWMVNSLGQRFMQPTIEEVDAVVIPMDISNLTAGIYLLQVVVEGELKEVVKVIIK